jgi:acyl carrier protein
MGIDALDLSFRLEKTFGIKISYEEGFVAFTGTAATLRRYLIAKLSGKCHRVPAFEPLYFEVTRAVNRLPKSSKSGVFAKLRENSHFPDSDELETTWKLLENELGVGLPSVEEPIARQLFQVFSRSNAKMALTLWITENHPERVRQWIPVSCERRGKAADRTWTEEEVWEAMCDCLVDVLGVNREEITPDARLIEDLGMA